MGTTNFILQKITDILLWDDSKTVQFILIVERDNSRAFKEKIEKIRARPYTTIIVENRCGKDGFPEIVKIISALNWEKVVTFILVTKTAAILQDIEDKIKGLVHGHSDIYGVDPDYYFSLVPLNGANHKNIECFILSLKSSITIKEKCKKNIKKTLVMLGRSDILYEQYVYCFYRDRSSKIS